MLSDFIVPSGIQIVILSIFLFLFLVQIFFYGFFFLKLAKYRETTSHLKREGVSVVICARNEYNQLKENLPLVLMQEYPQLEIVVVNHASEDDSSDLLSNMAKQYTNLKIVEIKENLNFFDGKKFPLSIGIKSATYDIILLTDADCKPESPEWVAHMADGFTKGTEIVLGYGSYTSQSGLLNRLIRFDTVNIAMQYLSFAIAGIPYMGVGRNMSYRKTLFYEKKGFTSHYGILSGDDDLFINQAATYRNTKIEINPESFIRSQPKKSFKEWWIQKKRHLSTGRYYRWIHKLLLGLYTSSIVLFYFLFGLQIILNYTIFTVLTLFALRLAIQLSVFHKILARLKEKGIWLMVPFFEIILILINFTVTVSTLLTKESKWK
jgi:cellulose synthase/poly-beta-1,6-N-acetylglucosamine synthase-like glycosyltransferase